MNQTKVRPEIIILWVINSSYIMSHRSNSNLWVTDWILGSFWSADDSVNILDGSGQESTECSLKLVGSCSSETSKVGLKRGYKRSSLVEGVIRGQILRQTCNQDHGRHEAYQWLEYPKQRFGSEKVAWKMLHENCCMKILHEMIKTYSFALACCFWILFDLDWSWWHCCCWCCSCPCSCSCSWSGSWLSSCSCPSSWSSSRFSRSCWSLSCSGCWSGSLSSCLSSSRSGSKTCCQYRLRRRNNHFNIIILERQTSKHCKQKQNGI